MSDNTADSDNRNIVYVEGDKIVYRSSAFGGCMKALALALAGEDQIAPPAQLQLVYNAGHEAEEVAVKKLEEMGHKVRFRQYEDNLVLGNLSVIRYHLDGTIDPGFDGGISHLLEVKSQSNDVFTSWTPDAWTKDPLWKKYAWQVSIPMLDLGKELTVVRINRDTGELAIHNYEVPFHSFAEVHERWAGIVALSEAEELRSLTCEESFGCPFYRFHAIKAAPNLVDDIVLTVWSADYLVKSAQEKWAKEQKEAAKKMLVARLTELGKTSAVLPDGTAISYTTTPVAATTREVKAYTMTRVTVTPRKDKPA